MKKLYTLIALIVLITINAQAPQGFNYQATVRNSAGALILNQNVSFKFNVIQNSMTGVIVYSENQTATTDDLGQVNLVVGQGTPTTGTFSTINWANGSYYLGIELNTGTSYVAMGTTQLLSVPYALYANSAGNSQSQGKTSIYLTGNITNAQAATKISAQLGPDTENIYITNTTQLTTVDLSALVSIATIEIHNNSKLININFNGLTTIENEFSSSNNSALSSFSFPSLLSCSSFTIYNSSLGSLNLPLLSYINNFELSIFSSNYQPTISALNFPSVQTIGGSFSLSGITSLTSLTFPIMQNLSGNISISPGMGSSNGFPVYNQLTTIDFSALKNCSDFLYNGTTNVSESSGSIYIRDNFVSDASLNLSSLTTCNSFQANNLANLNLSRLTSCPSLIVNAIANFTPPNNLASCNLLNISSMPNLTSLSFPSLSSCEINIVSNSLLSSLSFPALTNCTNLYLVNNALSTTKINSLLQQMLTVAPATGKNIDLSQQTPLAPPTGLGITAKQTLINNGNTVTTD